ncbi:hypothetical protein A8A54_18685 [Brucella pseudogrignonensis]|uniref:iron-siderophore ABC transporter substrate-binding protein n=1 Tax=Brucella pseudogrignonensis TaxID=419475 RepID=UPI0007DA7B32|nr:iron-siderophore ABC transporter substrate-binding protein [Brucella pseudogrignonensis]ANG98649.1 hypothetical protein A8A54_18685 [Brucella pseudogrignonensis]
MIKKSSSGLNRRVFLFTALGTVATFGRPAVALPGENSFPRSVSHFLGTTDIPSKPVRILTLGWGGEDALLALGIMPIAMPRYTQFDDGLLPWVAGKIGDFRPVLLNQGLIDFEGIASLKPDLILAVRTNINEQEWRRLQSIAPTVAYRSGPLQADWKEITALAGAATGRDDQAADLIKSTEELLRDLVKAHPAIKDRTFIFGDYFSGSNALGFYLPTDGRVASLLDLGLRPAPAVKSVAATMQEKIGTSISLELLDTMETDLLILWFPPGAREELETNELFKRYAPVARGSYIALDDPLAIWVACNPSVLSIPCGFPQFVARLEDAVLRQTESSQ